MNLEEKRIGTRIRLPFIPVMGELAIVLPKTAKVDRIVACLSGWALHVLGVPSNILGSTNDPASAIREATGRTVSYSLSQALAEVSSLNDRKRMKDGFTALEKAVKNNRTELASMFSEENVQSLLTQVGEVLAEYAAVDNPAPRTRG